ncbi:ParB N-terminal domain-containing protein [Streptomyces microflavus]|uniref:ParB N-terminal domain-containing protein n=1 Tax=Streptomyces microflavus TaxID=1919 RepID=UPI003B21C2B6
MPNPTPAADLLRAVVAQALASVWYQRAAEETPAAPEEHCAALADAALSVLPAAALAVARQLLGTTEGAGGKETPVESMEELRFQLNRVRSRLARFEEMYADTVRHGGSVLREIKERYADLFAAEIASAPAAPPAPADRAAFEALAAEWEKRGRYGDSSITDRARELRAVLAGEAAAGVQQTTEGEARPDDIQVWPLTRVLTEVRCGSQDWTWDQEWADLDQRHAESGYLDRLEQQIKANGITMPVLIGSDGRLWDGHHRLRIAVRLGIAYVPVEITPSAVAPAQVVARG